MKKINNRHIRHVCDVGKTTEFDICVQTVNACHFCEIRENLAKLNSDLCKENNKRKKH